MDDSQNQCWCCRAFQAMETALTGMMQNLTLEVPVEVARGIFLYDCVVGLRDRVNHGSLNAYCIPLVPFDGFPK